jgi:uncharacterized phage protein (TIGR01671 family)
MREIKFRVWDKENKKMSKVGAIDWNLACSEIITCNTQYEKLYNGYHEDFDFILMQYTGLKDKNGKEIYEGDVVKADYAGSHPFGEIVYDSGAFKVKIFDSPFFFYDCKVEVIGNIYENSELIGGRE